MVTLRDFNYLTPRVDLTSKANDSAAAEELELYEYPGGYDDGDAGDKLAQIRLEEIRVGASTAQGSGYSRRFSPGATFESSTSIRSPLSTPSTTSSLGGPSREPGSGVHLRGN